MTKRIVLAVVAAVATLAALTTLYVASRDEGRASGGRVTITPDDAAPAPRVAWADDTGVWRQDPGRAPVFLTGVNACCLQWAPGQDAFAYTTGNFLFVVQGGRAPRQVAENVGAWQWRPDGTSLAVKTAPDRVDVIDASGFVDSHFTIPGATIEDLLWDPDGLNLAIAASVPSSDHTDRLFMAHMNLRPALQLTEVPFTYEEQPDGYGILLARWSRDENSLYLWVDAQHSGSIAADGLPLVRVDIDTGAYTDVVPTLVVRSWVQPSPVGSKLLVVRSAGRMVTDPERSLLLCTDRCSLIGPAGAQVTDPAWSPDGTRIAFVVNRAPGTFNDIGPSGQPDWAPRYAQRELWVADGSGRHPTRLDRAASGVGWPQWIDNHTLTFVRDARLWLFDLDTDVITLLTPEVHVTDPPPNAAYDPTDINEFRTWQSIFAIQR